MAPTGRFIEYFIVVGGSAAGDPEVRPQLLQRFPREDTPTCALPQQIELLCLPTDCEPSLTPRGMTFTTPILTLENQDRLFCGCLAFDEFIAPSESSTDPAPSPPPPRSGADSSEDADAAPATEVQPDPSKPYYARRGFCVVSRFRFFDAFRALLLHLHALTQMEHGLVEQAVARALLQIPAPPLGSSRVVVDLPFGNQPFVLERPPPLALSTPNDAVMTLFELLDVDNVLLLFRAVLLGEKIVFQASSFTVMTQAAEALQQLMSPFEFHFTYVPTLPESLVHYMEALTPFIFGYHSAWPVEDPPVDVFFVDLDNNTITKPASLSLPELPFPEGEALRNGLRGLLHPQLAHADLARPPDGGLATVVASSKVSRVSDARFSGIVVNPDPQEPSTPPARPHTLTRRTSGTLNPHEKVDDRTKEIAIRWMFLRFFASLLKDLQKFFVVVRVNPDFEVKFDRFAFFHNRRRRLQQHFPERPESNEDFLSKLLGSETFHSYCRKFATPDREKTLFDVLLLERSKFPHPRELERMQNTFYAESHHIGVLTLPVSMLTSYPSNLEFALRPCLLDENAVAKLLEEIGVVELDECAVPKISALENIKLDSHDCEQSPQIDACLEALRDNEDVMMNWYITSFSELRQALDDEALAYALATRISQYHDEETRELTAMRFEVLSKLVEAALAHSPISADSPGAISVDRVASTLLPMIMSCSFMIEGVRKFLFHNLAKHPIWKDSLFWNSNLFLTIQDRLCHLYNVPCLSEMRGRFSDNPEEQQRSDQEEETVVTQILADFMRAQIGLENSDNDIRDFLRTMHMEIYLPYAALQKLQLLLAPQIAMHNQTLLAVYRKHPRKSILPNVCGDVASSSSDEPAVMLPETPFFIQSELQMEVIPNLLFLTPIEAPGEPYSAAEPSFVLDEDCIVNYARGTLYLTNYRIIFKGTWVQPPDHLRFRCLSPDGKLIEDHPDLEVTRSLPLASVTKVNWFQDAAKLHKDLAWASEGLKIRAKTFQMFRLLADQTAPPKTLDLLQARLSRLAFYRSVQDTFAVFTSAKRHCQVVNGAAQQEKVSRAVHRSLYHGSTRRNGSEKKNVARGNRASILMHLLPEDDAEPLLLDDVEGTNTVAYKEDMVRMGINDMQSRWRFSAINADFLLCPGYPSMLCVPRNIGDLDIAGLIPAFAKGRVPCVSWFDPNSGAALLRASTFRSNNGNLDDEIKLLEALVADNKRASGRETRIARSNSISSRTPSRRSIMIQDDLSGRRHSFREMPDVDEESSVRKVFIITQHSAKQREVLTESSSILCEEMYVDDENGLLMDLAQIKRGADLLSASCLELNDDSFLSDLHSSNWLFQISMLLHWASIVADLIELQSATVLVSLENGTDQATQIVSLAQLLCDPYYRTIQGFETLVRKEWLAFGHPFMSRTGSCSDVDNHTPIFLQFLDAVHQLVLQFPSQFEFNLHYLQTIAHHTYSMRFGTFLHDSELDRHKAATECSMQSLWTYLDYCHDASPEFQNFLYAPTSNTSPIRPNRMLAALKFWTPCFVTHDQDSLLFEVPMPQHTEPGISAQLVKLLIKELENQRSQRPDLQHSWRDIWNEWQEFLHQDAAEPLPSTTTNFTRGRTLKQKRELPAPLKGKLTWADTTESFMYPHRFKLQRLSNTICSHCGRRIWGIHPWVCLDCSQACHDRCRALVAPNCGRNVGSASSISDIASEVSASSAHRIRSDTRAFTKASLPKNYSSFHETSGILYKVGAIIKNWRKRWFFLDAVARELRYYRPPENRELRGRIRLNPGTQVHSVNKFQGKKSIEGYFVEIVTPKRTYVLRAATSDEREHWITAIASVISS
eukprot:m.11020 g.11020  ORF g.11020 m.11020 type:complete len:1832 (-) comp3123_c0_seq1:128-5623(-)